VAPVPSAEEAQSLKKGDKVEVFGLVSSPQMNGKRGEIVEEMNDKQRFPVLFPDKEKPVAIKPDNLRRVAAEPDLHHHAIKIQAVWRGNQGRREFEARIEECEGMFEQSEAASESAEGDEFEAESVTSSCSGRQSGTESVQTPSESAPSISKRLDMDFIDGDDDFEDDEDDDDMLAQAFLPRDLDL
jgi:hypothetical protein